MTVCDLVELERRVTVCDLGVTKEYATFSEYLKDSFEGAELHELNERLINARERVVADRLDMLLADDFGSNAKQGADDFTIGVDFATRESESRFVIVGGDHSALALRAAKMTDNDLGSYSEIIMDESHYVRQFDQLVSRGPVSPEEFNRIVEDSQVKLGMGRDEERQAKHRRGKACLDAEPRKAWQTCYGPARCGKRGK